MRAYGVGFLVVLAATALGCGGSIVTVTGPGEGDGGGGDSGLGDVNSIDSNPGDCACGADAGPDVPKPPPPWSPVCPPTVPSLGVSCAQEGLQCEYGGPQYHVSCDDVVVCQNGSWTTMTFFMPCIPDGPNPSACPADYNSVPQGATCDATGTECLYPQGMCACQIPLGGPIPSDGGTGYWGCVPEQGCPMPRPRLGTVCTPNSQTCTYEPCAFGESCQNGIWQGALEACAGGV